VQTPAIGDMDLAEDGHLEIVVGTNEDYDGRGRMYALHSDGTYMNGWPKTLPTVEVLPFVGRGLPNSPAMADVDGNGTADVAVSGIVALPTIIRGDGTSGGTMSNNPYGENTGSDDMPSFVAIANGSFGDLDNDGTMDLVWGGAGLGFAEAFASSGKRVDFDHHMGAWNTKTVQYLPGFPQRADDHQFFMNPAIADVDGDNKPEILNGSGGYYLRAWNYNGEQPEGWPKFTGGWVIASPAVGDLDGDGTLEVAVANREGYLYVWNTPAKTNGRVDWASFHHDDWNTGNYMNPIGFGTLKVEDDGCGCRAAGGTGLGGLLLVLAVLIGLRRRRS
jgi:MYXO-CTERM domain-containing protein